MSMKEKHADIHQDLIRSCRKNNKTAQLSIYKLYYKAMFNTSLRIVNNVEDAEDIMQEAFLEAFRKISTYRGNGSFGGWLKRIVINRSLDFVKARQTRISLGRKIMEMETPEPEDGDEPTDIDVRLDEVKTAMKKLQENDRIILALFLLEGYDHGEIARILGIPYGNVRTRYSRAKQKLMKEIMESRNNN
ncbi:MAG: sigma-70 family RNA polymerase sigma factor [Bacteroidales bacterium]|nr:sigma-70 family RNA polymerase sigma factor [Bacteroidales bacterium]